MAKAVLHVFEDYQKARISFVQTIAELSTRQQNVEALFSAGVMALLKPLLLDVVPSIQQSAALAIGRLASYSEELAQSVADNDIITQLMYSLPKQNRFFKKAACYILKAVAQHSVELAQSVVNAGALEPLVHCLDEFDPSVKEAAAYALGHIAKHNENLAHQVVEARAVDSLLLCLQEPELVLKRVSSLTLANICKHTEQLSQPVAENGLDVITKYINYTDTSIKRNVCNLLTNISKHSVELATLVMSKIVHPQKLLNCLRDPDSIVRQNAAMCICEIVNKSPETAMAISSAGGPYVITEYIANTKGDARMYGILSLAYMSAFKEDIAMQVINAHALEVLEESLQNDPEQVKCAVCFALNHIGRHSPNHANEVSKSGILTTMLTYYMDPNTSDDLKSKAKKAMNEIIKKCSNLSALEPLLHVASKEVLKNVLGQFVTYLKGNQKELANFARNGGLQKVLVLRAKMKENLLHYTEGDEEEEEKKPPEEEEQKEKVNEETKQTKGQNPKDKKEKVPEEEPKPEEEVKIKKPIPILELKTKAEQPIVQLAEEIVSYYPEEIVNYYSPEYAKFLLDKIGKEDSKPPEPPKEEENEEEKKEEDNKNVKGKPDDKNKSKGKIPSAKKKPTK